MKANSLYCCAAILSFAVAAPAFADSWTGTWKEDTSKDKSNATVSYTAKGAGFHFSNGSTIEYDFTCDGKVYPTYSNQSMKCTMTSDGGIDWTTIVAGKPVTDMHRSFSADGKTMIMDETIHLDDGTTMKETVTRIRKSGTKGLAGEWANSKVTYSEPDVMMISAKGDMYHFERQHSTVTLDLKFDGTEVNEMGKDATPGLTQSYKTVSATKLVTAAKLNGKALGEGTWTLSPDGKTMTVETWAPGKESSKSSSVYVKQ